MIGLPDEPKETEAVESLIQHATAEGASRHEQFTRLECLKCAVAGQYAGMNEAAVLTRATAFEQFVLSGTPAEKGKTQAWSGEDIMAESLRRAKASVQMTDQIDPI